MNKIASFRIDHTNLEKGLYISRIDDNIVTYDIRMVKPNKPPFLENSAIHTIEHIFATFARNKYPENIIYFGPMGCRTGFYLLTKGLLCREVISLVKKGMEFILNFEGKIPGSSAVECGNYLEHDIKKAKICAKDMCDILNSWDENKLSY